MSTNAALRPRPKRLVLTQREILQLAQEVVGNEARALLRLLGQLDETFYDAVELIHNLRGNLIVTGMGKAGHIGRKLAATFASTGTRAYFMHPAEAFHGDLGRVQPGDVVLAFSQSGETNEVVQLLPSLREFGVPLIAVTASRINTLGRAAEVVLELGKVDEACWMGLAPTTSTTVMLALGDALALVASRLKGFQPEDFARYHPGGALGRKLSHVEDHMRPLSECRVASATATVREVLVSCTKPGRRTGAIMLVNDSGTLAGLFTDSDLARLIERRHDDALDRAIADLMVASPQTVLLGSKLTAAVEILAERKISELPVVDGAGNPVGLIDVTDVLSLLPEPAPEPDEDEIATIRLYPSGDEN